LRILVTGGAGFLGSHLTQRLILNGHRVTVLDDLFTGSRGNLHPDVEFARWDVRDRFHDQADQIYHLAAPASPAQYSINPTRTLETILLGTRNALECARECGARVLIASTSEIYGDPLEHPQKESYAGNVNTLSPRGSYEEGKRAAETLAWGWAKQYGTSVRIARIFNVYGPRMNPEDGRLIPNLVTQALNGEAMTVYGGGHQTRSLCYVDDMVEGLMLLMEKDFPMNPFLANLGNPEERTVLEVARAVQAYVNHPDANIRHEALPEDDPKRRRPDITRASTFLGWRPKTSFEDGLAKTVAWFAARKDEEEG
jgi:UDP-glucuronate decarboxylase